MPDGTVREEILKTGVLNTVVAADQCKTEHF